MKERRLTTPSEQKTTSPEETRRRKTLDIDAIVDAYLDRWVDQSVSLEAKSSPGLTQRTSAYRQSRRNSEKLGQAASLAKEIFLAAIVAGRSRNEALYLARLSEEQVDHLVDAEEFTRKFETGHAQSPEVRALDLIIALDERDALEAAAEHAGGDFTEYICMCEDGRMDEIRLLVEAAAMRAAGKWYLVPASRRLEIQEKALKALAT